MNSGSLPASKGLVQPTDSAFSPPLVQHSPDHIVRETCDVHRQQKLNVLGQLGRQLLLPLGSQHVVHNPRELHPLVVRRLPEGRGRCRSPRLSHEWPRALPTAIDYPRLVVCCGTARGFLFGAGDRKVFSRAFFRSSSALWWVSR